MSRQEPKPRVLPHNLDAEAAILGGVLIRNEVLGLLPHLEVDDFYDPRHRAVFAAMRNLEAGMRPIDVVLVEEELQRVGKLDPIGGLAFLAELALRVPAPDNVVHYAEVVKQHRVSRETALRLGDVIEQIYGGMFDGDAPGDDAVAAGLEALRGITLSKSISSVSFGRAAMQEAQSAFRDHDRAAAGETVWTGIPTGFRQLDEHIGGIPLEVLTLVIARPAMGKTTFAAEVCRNAAELCNDIPIFVSLEDGAPSFGQRELAARSGVATQDIRRRSLNGDMVRALSSALGGADGPSPELLHLPGRTVDEVLREVRHLLLRPPPHVQRHLDRGGTFGRLIVVDYLSKLARPPGATGPRAEYEALSYASLTLSDLAAKDRRAVMALQQLSRAGADRDSKIPQLTDIRGSGRQEEDGKLILALWWPYYYDPKEDQHDYRVPVLKNHNGEANVVAHLYADMATNSLADSEIDLLARRQRRRARSQA